MPVTSQAQAGLFGVVAGGDTPTTDVGKLSKRQARESLRGVKVGDLPERAGADYNPQDETIGDWAQRHLEQGMRRVALDSARTAVPQTAPVGQEAFVDRMHEVADTLSGFEAAQGPLTDPPPELAEVVTRLQTDLDFVLHWLEEHGGE